MPTNEIYAEGRQIPLTVGNSVAARTPVVVGQIPGMTLTATQSSGTQVATVMTEGVVNLSVKGITTGGGNGAIAQGDILYYVPGQTPKLSKYSDGASAVRFGYAIGTVLSGATSTIAVLLGT
jgi:hypothetical protein